MDWVLKNEFWLLIIREHGGWLVIPTTETVCKTDWKTRLAQENSDIRVDEWPLSKQWCKSILGKLNFLVHMQSDRTDKKYMEVGSRIRSISIYLAFLKEKYWVTEQHI